MLSEPNSRQTIAVVSPADELLLRISQRAREEELFLQFRKRVVFALIGLIVSALGLVFATLWFAASSASSGFSEMASLLTSDGGYVLQHWQNYSLSLLETLPVINAIMSLALLFCVLWFAMRISGSVKGMRNMHRLMQH
jgi:cell division protein FtsL